MNDITVMIFPPFYTKRNIKKINKINPDILIFDDDFITPINEFNFSDSIIYLDFGKKFNKTLKDIKLPKYLKKIKFGDGFTQSLDYVKLPENLEVLEFGINYQVSLFSVKFPASLREIILKDSFNYSLPFFLPKKLKKIILGKHFDYSLNTFVIPENLKYLRVSGSESNVVLFNKLPQSIKTLEVINNLDFDMINLPDSLEELILDIECKDMDPYNMAHYMNIAQRNANLGNIAQGNIVLGNGNLGNIAQGNIALGNGNLGNGNFGNIAQGNGNFGNIAQGNIGPGNGNFGNIAQGNIAQGNIGLGNIGLGNGNFGNMAQGNIGLGNGNFGNIAQGNIGLGNGNFGNGNTGLENENYKTGATIAEQTNLPFGLKKLKLSHVSLINYIKKIPFNCELVDLDNNKIVLGENTIANENFNGTN